jgi:hypothetical protein
MPAVAGHLVEAARLVLGQLAVGERGPDPPAEFVKVLAGHALDIERECVEHSAVHGASCWETHRSSGKAVPLPSQQGA